MYVEGQEVSYTWRVTQLVFSTGGGLESVNGVAAKRTINRHCSFYASCRVLRPRPLHINIGDMTQFVNPFGINSIGQDGYTPGRLQDLNVDSEGYNIRSLQ